MIDKIIIRNFQNHRKIVLELDKITTILGPSDGGKTALFRAVRWWAFNRPSGNRYVRHGSKKPCEVVVYKNGKKAKHRKKGNVNEYFINGQRFSALRGDVPVDLSKFCRLTTSNFLNQFDAPVWFTLSPNQVAKEINRIADLSLLDRLQEVAGKDVREKRNTVGIWKEELEEAEEGLKKTKWVDQCSQEWKEIERLQKEIEQYRDEEFELLSLIQTLKEAEEFEKEAEEFERDANDLIQKRKESDEFAERYRLLSHTVDEITNRQNELRELEEHLTELEKLWKKNENRTKSRICPKCGQKVTKSLQ